ncbi:MAG: tetratricopeptide (TPR) repeat protein [Patiriisocius sp.]|jgi:tetratricopeptide (TPR) repeat protein
MKMKNVLAILVLGFILSSTSMSAQGKKYDYGADSASCVKQLFLFQEFVKQKAYTDALGPWEKAIEICPKSRKSLYTKGSKMFKGLIKAEADSVKKEALIEQLMFLFDTRIESFGQRGYVLGLKGVAAYKYHPENMDVAIAIMKESIELQGNKSKASVLSSYFSAIYKSFKAEKTPVDVLLSEYLVVSDIINYNLENLDPAEDQKSIDGFKTTKDNVDTYFIAVAECDDIVKFYGEKIAADPENLELNKKALSILDRKQCDDAEIFLQVTEFVHAKEPTAKSASALGRMLLKKQDVNGALEYFDQAVEMCGDCPDKLTYLTNAGLISISKSKIGKASSYANEMLKLDPKSGSAYIIKGDIARSKSKACDDGKAGSVSVYWLATDFYNKAKSVDPSDKIKEAANKKLASCRSRYPTKEELFFWGLKAGDPYTLPCGGATTVRISN